MDNFIQIKGIDEPVKLIDEIWMSYKSVDMRRDRLLRVNQVKNLVFTGLMEGSDGGEVRFMPRKSFFKTERSIMDSYDKIRVTDHKVEICNEVYYTSKIEGSHTTIARTMELHDGSPVDKGDYFSEMMVKQGFEATKFMNAHGNRLDMDILLNMWNILVDGCCSNESIRGDRFRIGDVMVGKHRGFAPDRIEDAISDWIRYYNSDTMNDHPFIKASLLHATYEKIHPFCDGNGRSGRLLTTNYLIGTGLDKCKAIAFSKQIADTISQYNLAFDESENGECDCTPFVDYMLSVYDTTFYDVLEEQISSQKSNQQDCNLSSQRGAEAEAMLGIPSDNTDDFGMPRLQ